MKSFSYDYQIQRDSDDAPNVDEIWARAACGATQSRGSMLVPAKAPLKVRRNAGRRGTGSGTQERCSALGSRTPVLAKRWFTWLFTVASLTKSRSAISRFERPCAIRVRTSASRGVSSSESSGRLATASTRWCWTAGSDRGVATHDGRYRTLDLLGAGVLGEKAASSRAQSLDH